MAGKMHTTRIDIPAEQRKKLVAVLNRQLADTLDLYSQTKFAHWNVKGSDFIQLHLFYDTLAEHVIAFVDLIAERATTLGGTALGTTRMSAKASTLDEFPMTALNGMDSVTALAERFAATRRARGRPSRSRRSSRTTTRATSSPRSRARSTRTSGSWRPICRRPDCAALPGQRGEPCRPRHPEAQASFAASVAFLAVSFATSVALVAASVALVAASFAASVALVAASLATSVAFVAASLAASVASVPNESHSSTPERPTVSSR